MIAPDLLALLRCPLTGQALTLADAEVLTQLNAGRAQDAPLEAALVRADGKAAFPVEGGIPVLLRESLISL